MATLTGNSIDTTYTGLLKTDDNGVIGATEKNITDGAGNASTLAIGTASASFTGTLDLSGATVTGLPGGAPGLVTTGFGNGMKSADALTTPTNTITNGIDHVILGSGNIINAGTGRPFVIGKQHTSNTFGGDAQIQFGWNTTLKRDEGIAIGKNLNSAMGDYDHYRNVNIGFNNSAWGGNTIAIGAGTDTMAASGFASTNECIAIGFDAKARASYSVVIGKTAVTDDAVRVNTVVIGYNTKAAQYSTAVGAGAFAVGMASMALGDANAAGNYAIAIGDQAQANFNNTVAIGPNVVATNWTDSTTVNQLVLANYSALNYADDTAAATGGVPLGGIYHNAGAMRIRIA